MVPVWKNATLIPVMQDLHVDHSIYRSRMKQSNGILFKFACVAKCLEVFFRNTKALAFNL